MRLITWKYSMYIAMTRAEIFEGKFLNWSRALFQWEKTFTCACSNTTTKLRQLRNSIEGHSSSVFLNICVT